MRDQLDEIRQKVDITEIIGTHVPLKRAGRNFKGLCPFHSEKTPSFVVSPDRQIWHCFGSCGEGGDVFKFLMKLENSTFLEVARELAKKTGVPLKDISFDDKLGSKRERFFALNHLASEFFNYVLSKTEVGKHAREYLKKRSIDLRLAQKFNLGYAPSSWDSLYKFLLKKKYTPAEAYEIGLLVRGKSGGYYDRFRGRLMFPIYDQKGNVVGFSGRILGGEGEAKYVNSPESLIYHKRESLYGIHLAKEAIRREQNIILVEGEFDVISAVSIGIENIAAIKGSAVTESQLRLVKRYTSQVILMLDSDAAGEDAVIRAIEEAEKLDLEVEVIQLTSAKDPDEAVHTDPLGFKKILKTHTAAYDFLIESYRQKFPEDNPYSKKKVAEAVIPHIERISNPIVKEHYVRKIARLLEVGEASVKEMMRAKRKGAPRQFTSRPPQKKQEEAREEMIQRYLLSLVFQSEDAQQHAQELFTVLSPEDFTIVSLKNIAESLQKFIKDKKELSSETFAQTLPSALVPAFDELYLFATASHELMGESIMKLALEVKKYSLKKKISHLVSSNGELTKDQESTVQDLSQKLKEVEKKAATV